MDFLFEAGVYGLRDCSADQSELRRFGLIRLADGLALRFSALGDSAAIRRGRRVALLGRPTSRQPVVTFTPSSSWSEASPASCIIMMPLRTPGNGWLKRGGGSSADRSRRPERPSSEDTLRPVPPVLMTTLFLPTARQRAPTIRLPSPTTALSSPITVPLLMMKTQPDMRTVSPSLQRTVMVALPLLVGKADKPIATISRPTKLSTFISRRRGGNRSDWNNLSVRGLL